MGDCVTVLPAKATKILLLVIEYSLPKYLAQLFSPQIGLYLFVSLPWRYFHFIGEMGCMMFFPQELRSLEGSGWWESIYLVVTGFSLVKLHSSCFLYFVVYIDILWVFCPLLLLKRGVQIRK